MANQREYESVVWFALQRYLKGFISGDVTLLYDYFYSSANQPQTDAQKKRFELAAKKVLEQMERFEGDERP
tara:strand:+ start:2099 stop:2311 length:213 start_codon:yes stop_codon:yes gene_type:complete